MGIAGDLAADLAEMVVHREGIADWHDQRRRFALRGADRAKHIGRGKAEVLGCRRPTAGLPPHPGQAVLLADAGLGPGTTPRLAHRVVAPSGLALITILELRKLRLRRRIGLRVARARGQPTQFY